MDPAHRQLSSGLRVDWGLVGARAVAAGAGVVVVVDVLSFTTTLSVALDVGTAVLPYHADQAAAAFAQEQGAELAVARDVAVTGQVSLSPATLRAAPPPARVVLPSPNGSTICRSLAGSSSVCLGASLRNAAAVGAWLAARYGPGRAPVAVVAAGERWPARRRRG